MLRELQRDFSQSLLSGKGNGAAHIEAGKLGSEERLAIYRHNVYTNLTNALGDIFPVVQRIVGADFFREAARVFIREVPSTSGDLNRYGGRFGDFLAAYPHAAELPYLPDVARLEWAWQEAFHAAEAVPLDLARLAAMPEERHGDLIFQLHPSAHLLASDFPLLDIWRVNQDGYEGDLAVDWSAGRGYFLVFRPDREVGIAAIPAPDGRFLAALASGERLEAAIESLGPEEFDLQGFLLESVQSGLIVNFHGE